MFMLMLYRYITGYVKFAGEGRFLERFLNLCARDGINVWNSYFDGGKLYGCMRVCDYRRIRKNARKAQVRLRVTERHGFNFLVYRYRRRYGIAAGFAVYVALIMLLSSFIWCVDVVGNEKVESSEIMNALRKVGVYEGSWRPSIDTEISRQQMLIDTPKLSWAAINIRGCFATVDVRETEEKAPEISYEPCNVVAKLGGRILSIKAYYGIPSVKVGEAVAQGDLLVSGAIELKTGATKFTNATAEVIAETEHELSVFVPYKQTDTVKSPQAISHSVLTLFGMDIPLFLGGVDKPYEVNKQVHQPIINNVRLPLKITTAKFYKTSQRSYVINSENCKKIADERMEKMAQSQLKGIMVSANEGIYEVSSGGVTLKKVYTCREDIAKQENILIKQ